MPEGSGSTLLRPLTRMNFIVEVTGKNAAAAFTEVSGIEATVDMIEFRQGNSNSLAPIKIPGLVKYGNVTLKMGYTLNSGFSQWIRDCISATRGAVPMADVKIQLVDISETGVTQVSESVGQGGAVWVLKNAWVQQYTAPELSSTGGDAVAIESVQLVYESLQMPGEAEGGAGA